MLLYYDNYVTWIYFFFELLLYTYKGYALAYPRLNLATDLVALILLVILQMGRIHVASVGNKTERSGPTVAGLLLGLIVIGILVYFMDLQTYVLRVDVYANAILITFLGLELVLGFLAAIIFKGSE